MARQARLDIPDALHRVIIRGIGRRNAFRNDRDRNDFIARLASLGGCLRILNHLLANRPGGQQGHVPCFLQKVSLAATISGPRAQSIIVGMR